MEKNLGISKGVYFRLVNIETNENLKKDQENCNYINSLENINTTLNHSIRLSFENRNRDKWRVNFGGKEYNP